jgi:hypothetical protein
MLSLAMRQISTWHATLIAVLAGAVVGSVATAAGQLDERAFSGSPDHPSIGYARQAFTDPVAELNRKILGDAARLTFDEQSGYLRSVLKELNISVESQMMVFSKTGVQAGRTSPANPRALFFNDSVIVGYVRGAPIVELAAHDPRQGAVFYTLDQNPQGRPTFTRRDSCLSCHVSFNSLDVPGMLVRSQFTASSGLSMRQLGQYVIDHRSPFEQRWGGYYVTGTHGSMRHMGNATVIDQDKPESMITNSTLNVRSLEGTVDTTGYPLPSSDIVALMVFDHQMHIINLLTRIGWEVRVALYEHRLDLTQGPQRAAVNELVDYLLFIDEAPLPGRVQGVSGFADTFSAQGPRDTKNRSLRQLDLERHLMRYPCSYMIYADAFDSLPSEARAAVYQRMWHILSGEEKDVKYARLSAGDRHAIVEILRDTKQGLPNYFQAVQP